MHEKSDAQLLRDYAQHGDQAAFRDLVTRYSDLVYCAALRQVNSPDLARDIAQSVFTDLARKARPLGDRTPSDSSLAGWLHRSTRYAVLSHVRDLRRRRVNERQTMEQLLINSESGPDWDRIGPVLDEALDSLGDEDRESLLLRYFKNHDFRAIGVALGVSDDAAQKRVSRALEKLRAEFNRRGVTTSAVALSTAVSVNAVSVGPAGLATTLSSAALTGTTLTTTATATNAIAMTTLQKAAIVVALTAAVGVGIYEARQVSTLRSRIQTLQQQQAPLAEQNERLSSERDNATLQLSALRNENERLNRNAVDLVKLRGEVGRLRNEVAQFNQMGERNNRPTQGGYNERMPVMSAAMNMLVNAMNRFAWENNGRYPTNFNQLEQGRLGWISLNAPGGDIDLDSFEILNSGAESDALPKSFLVRERISHKNPDGRWERFYASSDGSVERIQSDDDNFDAWERLHMVLPVSSKQ